MASPPRLQPPGLLKVRPKPSACPPASSPGLLGATALTFITEAYNVQKGDTILVHTVAGGLGLLFAQLAKARGATVIGTTSTPAKAELARALEKLEIEDSTADELRKAQLGIKRALQKATAGMR